MTVFFYILFDNMLIGGKGGGVRKGEVEGYSETA